MALKFTDKGDADNKPAKTAQGSTKTISGPRLSRLGQNPSEDLPEQLFLKSKSSAAQTLGPRLCAELSAKGR
jgi:hypothetical protein